MATITATTTATATMRPIATADNPSTWFVCLFVASSSELLKILVVPEFKPFTVDVVGRVEVVDKAADVTIPFKEVVPGCFVVDTDPWVPTFFVVLSCVVEDVVCTLKVAEVVGAIDRGETVVWDKVPDNGIVDCDVARDDVVDVDMDDVGDDVDRGLIVEEDVEVGAWEEIVVDMYVASVLVQSKTKNAGILISFNRYIQKKESISCLKTKESRIKSK